MRNNEKNIRVEMFRVVGDMAPLVKVYFMDKNSEEHSGLFILDSVSNDNFLTIAIMGVVGDLCKKEGVTGRIYTISGEYVSVDYVGFSFAFGGNQFHEDFGINEGRLPKMAGDLQIMGILGQQFMEKHHLVIDYSNFTIHTSDVSPKNLSIEDCDFFTPMEVGLKCYEMPLLYISQNGKVILALADTGASHNMLTSQTVIDNGFDCQFTEDIDIITGLAGDVQTNDAIVKFNLLTLKGNSVMALSHQELFKVVPHYIYTPKDGLCDEDGEQLPPVEAIICSPFMAKEGWILDFGAKIIYKRKEENDLKEAV